ncbi:MAG: hypothetical protein QNK68_06305 [Flavobacteriales bacterium]
MKLNQNRIVLSRDLDEDKAFLVYSSLENVLNRYNTNNNYFLIDLDVDFGVSVITYDPDEIQWLARELGCTDREAVICVYYYDGFLEDLKDVLYINGINDYKRYYVVTKEELLDGKDVDYGDYIGKSKEDAFFYFENIVGASEIISIQEDYEEEKGE